MTVYISYNLNVLIKLVQMIECQNQFKSTYIPLTSESSLNVI